jgi:hypothetical protein
LLQQCIRLLLLPLLHSDIHRLNLLSKEGWRILLWFCNSRSSRCDSKGPQLLLRSSMLHCQLHLHCSPLGALCCLLLQQCNQLLLLRSASHRPNLLTKEGLKVLLCYRVQDLLLQLCHLELLQLCSVDLNLGLSSYGALWLLLHAQG